MNGISAQESLSPPGIAFIDRATPPGGKYDREKGETKHYNESRFYTAEEVETLLLRAEFRAFAIRQTIFSTPGEIEGVDPVREGHGDGGFVGISAEK